MVNRSKMPLQERTRPPRAIAATPRGRAMDDEAMTYVVSAVIAVAAMVMAAMAGFVR